MIDYSREFQAQAAEELALLPQGSAIGEMLADYAVMREQARVCSMGTSVHTKVPRHGFPANRR